MLAFLRKGLPDSFVVYAEYLLDDGRTERAPDFTILADYGLVVLEVKDIAHALRMDNYWIWTPGPGRSEIRQKNPVRQAREAVTLFIDEIHRRLQATDTAKKPNIAWGYAAVFTNMHTTGLSRLQTSFGKNRVLSLDQFMREPAEKLLRETLPHSAAPLTPSELKAIREVINPIICIESLEPTREELVLDLVQELLVCEPSDAPEEKADDTESAAETMRMLTEEPIKPVPPAPPVAAALQVPSQPTEAELEPRKVRRSREDVDERLPEEASQIVQSGSVRLVRGVAGSGKTLVLTKRAEYLAAQHPDWRICILTYNNLLSRAIESSLRGRLKNLRVSTFHKLCREMWERQLGIPWRDPVDPNEWLDRARRDHPIISELGVDYVAEEIEWRKNTGITQKDEYLRSSRRGRGRPLGSAQREAVWAVMAEYQRMLREQEAFDWSDLPTRVWSAIEERQLQPPIYDAVLIDEAQDMAPVWMWIVTHMVRPGGVLFLADDPTQSIYRYYSWREKGVPVRGRTRWLRVPYRNTREIYRAAYEIVRTDPFLLRQLSDHEGQALIEPDTASEHMASGPRPSLRSFRSANDEQAWVRNEVDALIAEGTKPGQIAVLARYGAQVKRLEQALQGTGISTGTFHRQKGLEFDVVLLVHLDATFGKRAKETDEALSAERRLIYMAMTRARRRLNLSYSGSWPRELASLRQFVDIVPT